MLIQEVSGQHPVPFHGISPGSCAIGHLNPTALAAFSPTSELARSGGSRISGKRSSNLLRLYRSASAGMTKSPIGSCLRMCTGCARITNSKLPRVKLLCQALRHYHYMQQDTQPAQILPGSAQAINPTPKARNMKPYSTPLIRNAEKLPRTSLNPKSLNPKSPTQTPKRTSFLKI